jgi:hemolysin D
VAQVAELNSKLVEIDRQLAQKEAERDTIDASIKKLQAIIPVVNERVDVRKYLYGRELGSKLIYLTELQDLIGQQQELEVQKSKYREADAAIAALKQTRQKTAAEYRRTCFDELAKAEQKAGGLTQDAIKAKERTNL